MYNNECMQDHFITYHLQYPKFACLYQISMQYGTEYGSIAAVYIYALV